MIKPGTITAIAAARDYPIVARVLGETTGYPGGWRR